MGSVQRSQLPRDKEEECGGVMKMDDKRRRGNGWRRGRSQGERKQGVKDEEEEEEGCGEGGRTSRSKMKRGARAL